MKNIHILPTDEPSRLVLESINNNLFLTTTKSFPSDIMKFQNIYITFDEEIKRGDCILLPNNEIIVLPTGLSQVPLNNFIRGYSLSDCKKIILTTDQDLIKDGVQAIDDEFLEWFVKNPSCEEVEVKRNKKLSNKSIWDAVEGDLVFNNHNCGGIITQLSDDVRVHIISENGEGYMETAITSDNGLDTLVINNYKVYEYSGYKIIIPKEEPKQETLEEAAEKYSKNELSKLGFLNGVKWQQERSYSEEEIYNLIQAGYSFCEKGKNREDVKKWFEQFKKK